jgi:solute carrier family 25 thiamine pyrophosphate transporter 19
LKTIVQQEGITGLWKGNVPAEIMYVAYGCVQFVTYRNISDALESTIPSLPNAAQSFIAGAGAGALATTATYPLDLLRTRFAAQGTDRVYASLISSIRDIAQHEGLHGFFQGLVAGVGQVFPYMGLFFSTYESLRLPLASLQMPFGSSDAVAGVLAGVAAKTGVFPLDLIRKRLQVQGPTRSRYVHKNIPAYKGIFPTLKTIIQKEGMRGLYRGLTVSLIKAAPASAITMWTYERALHILMEIQKETEE